jgi:hypothetical protein
MFHLLELEVFVGAKMESWNSSNLVIEELI